MTIRCTTRYAVHPNDFKTYDTQRIRDEFLVEKVMEDDHINLVYSHFDRFIVGGAVPATQPLTLESVDHLKSEYFLERREMGIINVGGLGRVITEKETFELQYKEALYLGRGTTKVVFESADSLRPARFYLNSVPAHHAYPSKLIRQSAATVLKLGSTKTANERIVNQLLIQEVVQTCQLQMGLTELKPGSVWNTMPAHTPERRMETYFYFEVPDWQTVCHFMGQPNETRHLFLKNEEAVISPSWSIHSAAGTANYCFIWGMAGENLDYTDMDQAPAYELR